MDSISLEKFYANFDRHVKFASSFTDKKAISKIITMCRLKPHSIVFEEYSERMILHEHWIDEYRNSLFIRKNKKIDLKLNNLSLNCSKIVDTDLYGKLSIDKVASISKFVFFLSGKDEDTSSSHYILSFLGIDDFLRTFVFVYGEWFVYPSLYLGIKILSEIANNLDINFHKEIKSTKKVIYPCISQKCWLNSWPPSKDFVSIMNEENNSLPLLLNLNKGK